MKINSLFALLLLVCKLNGQLQITNGAKLVGNGQANLVLRDMNFVNNGILVPGGGSVKFTGVVPSVISGVPGTDFNDLVMAKTGNTSVTLQTNIQVNNRVVFESGLLELNQQELSLAPSAYLENESAQSRITGTGGGEVRITLPLVSPVQVNPGNLGAVISSPADMGNVTIRRGHQAQSGTGLSGSMHRYYDISPSSNAALNATLRFRYLDPEMNGQAEDALTFYRSADAGSSWTNQFFSLRNNPENYVELAGISQFSRWTLSSYATSLPVTGMEFSLKRVSEQQVQLQWKTQQEFNNKGFFVQRRKAHETEFSTVYYVPSAAPGGNSYLPLLYKWDDNNSYKGITYYRIQQEDLDGKQVYSAVRFITGAGDKTAILKLWPVPSSGEINVLASGIEKELLQVFDMKGSLVSRMVITGGLPVKLVIRQPGTYVVRLGDSRGISQQIVVQ